MKVNDDPVERKGKVWGFFFTLNVGNEGTKTLNTPGDCQYVIPMRIFSLSSENSSELWQQKREDS